MSVRKIFQSETGCSVAGVENILYKSGCCKFFIDIPKTFVYIKFHDKRRHSSVGRATDL